MTDAAFFDSVRASLFGGRLSTLQVIGIEAIAAAWKEYGDGDKRKLAYLLATAKHETANTMQPIYERGPVSYFNKYEPPTKKSKDLGNTEKGDGFRYRGRGFVQLTGRANYRRASGHLSVAFEANPDLALSPEHAAAILVKGCLEGWFTGRKLSGYINAGETDFINARRVVNGTDRAVLIAGYAVEFERALQGELPRPAPQPPAEPVSPPPPDIEPPEAQEPPKRFPWGWLVVCAMVAAAIFIALTVRF